MENAPRSSDAPPEREPAGGEPVREPVPGELEAPSGPPAPYRNLWVPLLVVPAAIVMVLVCVFLFFGAIAGHQRTLDENLALVVSGGANERKQAAFNLGVQIAENQRAEAEGEPLPWPVDGEFLPRLQQTWEAMAKDDLDLALLVACLQAQGRAPEGLEHLLGLAATPVEDDPDGRVRFQALAELGALADPRAAQTLVRALDEPDPGLRAIAAIALQRQPAEEATTALREALGDEALEVRANAALSLALRGDAAGAPVLRELLEPALYEAEHERAARRFARAELVSKSRASAVEALGALGLAEDRARVEAMARDEADLTVRGAALRALEEWGRAGR